MSDAVAKRGVRIRVPASTSNLGSAFDAVGLALRLYLTFEMRELKSGPSRLEYFGEDPQLIVADATNFLWRTMEEIAAEAGVELPYFDIRVENEIPIMKGLGSSGAAILAAAAAVSYFCGLHWEPDRLLEIATAREGHPDNVAPSLWGGLVASISGAKVICSRSEFPDGWTVVAVTPEKGLETQVARAVLPSQIPYPHAVYNIQRAAFLMAQLVQGRREGLREAMSDMLHQSYRCDLLPGLKEILAMESSEGLLGVALSGAGSTVVALADSHEAEIGARITRIFQSYGIAAQTRLLKADNTGLILNPL